MISKNIFYFKISLAFKFFSIKHWSNYIFNISENRFYKTLCSVSLRKRTPFLSPRLRPTDVWEPEPQREKRTQSVTITAMFAYRHLIREPRGPHSQNLMTGGGGVRQRFIFIPKKITTSKFVYPKKSLSAFFATQKNPSVFFFATQKNPGVFHRPQKITFGQNFRPKKNHSDSPVIKICEWRPWEGSITC